MYLDCILHFTFTSLKYVHVKFTRAGVLVSLLSAYVLNSLVSDKFLFEDLKSQTNYLSRKKRNESILESVRSLELRILFCNSTVETPMLFFTYSPHCKFYD